MNCTKIADQISNMTLREKIGQLIMTGLPTECCDEAAQAFLEETKVGNIILFSKNIVSSAQTKQLTDQLKKEIEANTGVIPFIAVDQEGGEISRFPKDALVVPSAMAVSATKDANNARICGEITGSECNRLGINMDLAPVMDINCNPHNPVIGIRSYSDEPGVAARFGTAMQEGLLRSNIVPSIKHFPGHGDTETDSHLGLPVIYKSWEDLKQFELLPFVHAIQAGALCVTTSHILFPNIDSSKVPATMSYEILTKRLRQELGFEGIILTDCLEMAAIKENYGVAQGAVRAIEAGATICDISHTWELVREAMDAIEHAVNSGSLSVEIINQAVIRVLTVKQQLLSQSLTDTVKTDLDHCIAHDRIELDSDNFQKIIHDMTIHSLTRQNEVPFPEFDAQTLFIGCNPYARTLAAAGTQEEAFAAWLGNYYHASYLIIERDPNKEQIAAYLEHAANYKTVIVCVQDGSRNSGQMTLINELKTQGKVPGVIFLTNPYDAAGISAEIPAIVTYGKSYSVFQALTDAIDHNISLTGTLPVAVDYVAGIDGGGTKTSVRVVSTKGYTIAAWNEESINYNGRAKEEVDQTLTRIMKCILEKGGSASHCKKICIGTAGVSNTAANQQMKAILSEAFPITCIQIVGDQEIAYALAKEEDCNLVLIAGTGSICFGLNQDGTKLRSGGYGYLIDDEGGAYRLGIDCLRAIVRMEDGRQKKTCLRELVYSALKINQCTELISFVYSPGTKKQDIAALAPLLSAAVKEHDAVAEEIIHTAASELVLLVDAVLRQKKNPNHEFISLAVTGSVLKNNVYLRDELIRQLQDKYRQIRVVCLERTPVEGAVAMALEK